MPGGYQRLRYGSRYPQSRTLKGLQNVSRARELRMDNVDRSTAEYRISVRMLSKSY